MKNIDPYLPKNYLGIPDDVRQLIGKYVFYEENKILEPLIKLANYSYKIYTDVNKITVSREKYQKFYIQEYINNYGIDASVEGVIKAINYGSFVYLDNFTKEVLTLFFRSEKYPNCYLEIRQHTYRIYGYSCHSP